VQCVLKEVMPGVARIEISGRVWGTVNGAAAQLDLKAKCRFDRQTNRIDWFAMLIGRKQEIGPVELLGWDVVARVQIKISGLDEAAALGDAALADLSLKPTPELCQLLYQPAVGDWQLTHDRSWFLVESQREFAVMHRMVQGKDLGQGNILPLPSLAAGKLPTLAQFQEDVRHVLGKNFGSLVAADEFPGEADQHVYRVVVKGEVSEVPIQWQYFLVADEHGRRVSFAFTVKEQNLDDFGRAGEQLVRRVRFLARAN
jgi:hypothetical protein